MKLHRLSLWVLLLTSAVVACDSVPYEALSKTCSKDKGFVDFLDDRLTEKKVVSHERKMEGQAHCILYSTTDEQTAKQLRNWFNDLSTEYHSKGKPPDGSVSGSAERVLELKNARQRAKIPYTMTRYQGAEHISWDERYDEEAKTILKQTWGWDITASAKTEEERQEAKHSWAVDEKAAAKIVLQAYPNILKNAHLVGPVPATLGDTDLPGFADAGEHLWHVRVHCDQVGRHATFFVHPTTGRLFTIVGPDDQDSVKCK